MGSVVAAVPSVGGGPGVHMGLGSIAMENVLNDHQISPPSLQPIYTATALVVVMKRSTE